MGRWNHGRQARRACAAALVLTWAAAAACGQGREADTEGSGDSDSPADTAAPAGEMAARDTVGGRDGPPDSPAVKDSPAAPDTGSREGAGGPAEGTAGESGRDGEPAGAADPSSGAAAVDTVEGVVRQVGNVPFVMTVVQGDDTVAVTGPYEEELGRASGIVVRIVGRRTQGRYPGPTLDVSEYRLVSVSGETPHEGWLRRDADGYYLERPDADPLRLAAVPAGLRERVGAKVWMLTSEAGAVQQYGVLRPPETGEPEP